MHLVMSLGAALYVSLTDTHTVWSQQGISLSQDSIGRPACLIYIMRLICIGIFRSDSLFVWNTASAAFQIHSVSPVGRVSNIGSLLPRRLMG